MKTKFTKIALAFVCVFALVLGLFVFNQGPTLAADGDSGTGTFKQCTGTLTSGYYVFGVGDSAASIAAVNTTPTSNWIKFTNTTSTSGTITNPDASIVWYYDEDAGTLNNGTNYVAWPTTGNSAGLKTTGTPLTVTETTTAGVYNITVTATPARILRLNGTSGYRFYDGTTGKATFYFFKLEENAGGGESGGDSGTTTPPCEHTNTTAIGEAKPATCTEDGITAGEKCADCGKVVTAQETIPATGHNYVDGVCSVCNEKQPTTLTINRDSFGEASGYAWHSWTVDGISGSGFIYGTTTASIQVSGKQSGDYIYNTTALPGKIVSITLTKASGTDRNFDILTSDTPFDSATTALLKGQATDAKKTVTTEGVTWTFETNHKYFAIVILDNGATNLSSIEITYEVCKHTNTTAIGEYIAPDCTTEGMTAGLKCSDCGEILTAQETIDALGHTDENPKDSKCDTCGDNLCTEHTWVDGDVKVEGDCTTDRVVAQVCKNCNQPGEDKTTKAPGHDMVTDAAVDPTCTTTGLTAGEHCKNCDKATIEREEIPALGHTLGANTDCTQSVICTVCEKEIEAYRLVTDVSTLKAGDTIIIVAAGYEFALGTNQKTNNRGQASVVKNEDKNILVIGTDVQVLTLQVGNKENTWAFNTGSGYLYAAATGDNYLRTENTLSDNGSWSISIKDGIATVKAQGTNENNWLRYNTNNSIFSCYASGQKDIAIYKLVEKQDSHTGGTATCEAKANCSVCGTAYGELAAHDYSVLQKDGTHHWYKCSGCEAVNTKVEHNGQDDGNCATAVKCNVCEAEITAAKEHAWDNSCDTTCGNKGCTHTREITHTPRDDDGDCTTAIHCVFCDAMTTPGNASHSFDNDCDTTCNNANCNHTREITHIPNADDGDCTTAIVCSVCGVETTAAKAHAWDNACDTACNNANCNHTRTITHTPNTDDGDCTTEVTCSVCGTVTTPANATHTGGTATCEAKANCSICGTAYGELGAHKYDSIVTAPTCTDKGYTTHTCSVCGDSYTNSEVPATGHVNTTTVTVDETCVADGSVTVTCACGTTVSTTVIPATGHAWGEWAVTTPAVCTEKGVETRTCSNCDATETQDITAIGHDYTPAVTAPTCTEDGYTTHTCANCKNSYTSNTVEAKGHSYTSEVTIQPTYTKEGVRTFTCSACDDSYTETIPAITCEHSYNTVVTDPTCTAQGYTTYTCSKCGYNYNDDYTTKLDHTWGEGVVTTAPTCTVDGVRTFTCSCGATKTEVESATGHDYSTVVTAPTCTEGGYTTYTCSCGDTYVANRTEATGHVNTTTVTVDATCTAEGSVTVTCDCGVTVSTTVIPATGHAYGEWVVTQEPTEDREGSKTKLCADCGDVVTESVPALDHTHEYSAVVTAPTCTEGGYTTHTCSCGDSYVDGETEALKHDFVDGTCSRCDAEDPDHVNEPAGDDYVSRITLMLGKIWQKIVAIVKRAFNFLLSLVKR